MTRYPRGTAMHVVCPKCGKPGAIYAYTVTAKSSYQQIVIRHRNRLTAETCYLSQSKFPELYQAFFPILLSPRMERIMEAMSPK